MRKRVTLKYHQVVQVNPGAGIIQSHKFLLNGAQNPDASTTGHQPLGWDQYILQYDRYTVVNCGYKVQFFGGSGSYKVATLISRDNALAFSTIDAAEEQPFIKPHLYYSTQVDKFTILKGRVNMRKWLRRPYWEANVTSTIAGVPTMLLYLYCMAWAANQTDDPGAISIGVTLYYDTIFWDRINDQTQD